MNEGFEYAVEIPTATADGEEVTIQSEERSGMHILHAESPDRSELYFEVTAYPGILDRDTLVKEQQDFLRERSEDGNLTEITRETLAHQEATTFDFRGTLQGRWKERRFLFLDGASRTYRVVYDPTSPLNVRLLSSLELLGAKGPQRSPKTTNVA